MFKCEKQEKNLSWTETSQRFEDSFKEERSKLMNLLVISQNLFGVLCTLQNQWLYHYICKDCKVHSSIFITCDDVVHSEQPFHDRICCTEDGTCCLSPTQTIDENGNIIDIGNFYFILVWLHIHDILSIYACCLQNEPDLVAWKH